MSAAGESSERVLEVRDLSVSYGKVEALSNANLDVGAGQIVTVIGPNGAGKTSLFHCLTGERQATADLACRELGQPLLLLPLGAELLDRQRQHDRQGALAGAWAQPGRAIGRVLAEQGAGVRDSARADLAAMFSRHYRAGEGVMLPCKVWLVTAHA